MVLRDTPDGWIGCTIRADSIDIAVECVLSLAGQAIVVEPAQARERVAAAAPETLARLGS